MRRRSPSWCEFCDTDESRCVYVAFPELAARRCSVCILRKQQHSSPHSEDSTFLEK